jgi:catechol 2,3-dioxygenase-like lactoylglutathione lyase family enzyme
MPQPFDASERPEPPILDSVARAASPSTGSVPDGGFNALVPELDVSDLQSSLRFWCGLLGFKVAYDRPAARFAYLVRGPLQIMLCERNGNWEVGELSPPFGRGINFQMNVERLTPILETLKARSGRCSGSQTRHGTGPETVRAASESFLSKTPTVISCDLPRISERAHQTRVDKGPSGNNRIGMS